MDVVYPYKLSSSEELEYSLKSLQNIDYEHVYIIGDKPPVGNHVPLTKPYWASYGPAHDQIAKYYHVKDMETSDSLLLMNDDFYCLGKWTPENYNRGTLEQHIKDRRRLDYYTGQLQSTQRYLTQQGLPTLSYELHTPFLVDKAKLIQAIEELLPYIMKRQTVLIRSYYGNRFGIESKYMQDVKNPDDVQGKTLLSTSEKTFNNYVGYIKSVLY